MIDLWIYSFLGRMIKNFVTITIYHLVGCSFPLPSHIFSALIGLFIELSNPPTPLIFPPYTSHELQDWFHLPLSVILPKSPFCFQSFYQHSHTYSSILKALSLARNALLRSPFIYSWALPFLLPVAFARQSVWLLSSCFFFKIIFLCESFLIIGSFIKF